MTIAIPSHLSDGALIAEVARCARDERHAAAQLVAHLAELGARRLYLSAGHSSLFTYRRDGLGLSDDAAYNYDVSWGFAPVPERPQQDHRAPRSAINRMSSRATGFRY